MRRIRLAERPGADNTGRDFAMQEHLAMLGKLDRAGEDIYRTETVVPLAIAGYYAWLLSRTNCVVMPWWLYLVPPVLSALGGARYIARRRYIRQVETYVRMLEAGLRGINSSAGGWEHYFENKLRWYWSVRALFWSALTVATAAGALLYYWSPGVLCASSPAAAYSAGQSNPEPLQPAAVTRPGA
jgi:hypothetical protein